MAETNETVQLCVLSFVQRLDNKCFTCKMGFSKKKITHIAITRKVKAIHVNMNVQPTEFVMKLNSFISELLVSIW